MKPNVTNQYLAGVLDSDGSFTISKRHTKRKTPNYIVQIQISWNKSDNSEYIFKFLSNTYGGSFCELLPHKGSLGNKKILKYCATGKAAERILIDCRHYVIIKQKQVFKCLELLNTIEAFKTDHYGRNRPIKISKKLEKLYLENKKLNG